MVLRKKNWEGAGICWAFEIYHTSCDEFADKGAGSSD